MKIQVITLFPDMFPGVLNASMLWKAQDRKLLEISYINLRDFGIGPRKQVDDTPYGGGDGMVLKPEPIVAAIEAAACAYSSSIEWRRSVCSRLVPSPGCAAMRPLIVFSVSSAEM